MSELLSLSVLIIVLFLEKDKLLSLFRKKKQVSIETYVENIQETVDPFIRFPCDCKEQLELAKWILPGQAAVLKCENCQTSWTVYNPTLVVNKTKELPEGLQKVWEHLSNEPQ